MCQARNRWDVSVWPPLINIAALSSKDSAAALINKCETETLAVTGSWEKSEKFQGRFQWKNGEGRPALHLTKMETSDICQ